MVCLRKFCLISVLERTVYSKLLFGVVAGCCYSQNFHFTMTVKHNCDHKSNNYLP